MSTAPLRRRHVLSACAASFFFASATAAAAPVMQVDQLTVFSGGTLSDWRRDYKVWLYDGFDDGNPRVGPALESGEGHATYTLGGGSAHPELVSETGGQLLMVPSLGDVTTSPAGIAARTSNLYLDTDAADPANPFSLDRTFGVMATFAISTWPGPGQNFGLRLIDQTPNGTDSLRLHLTRDHGVNWQRYNSEDGSVDNYGWIHYVPPSDAESVLLYLGHTQADDPTIEAGWGYLDDSGQLIDGRLNVFGTTATAFHGGSTTTLSIRSLELLPAVPEPTTSSLMAVGGLAIAAAARRRSGRSPKNRN